MITQNLSGSVLNELDEVKDNDIDLIQSLKNPPLKKLTANDIYVRAVRLAGDPSICTPSPGAKTVTLFSGITTGSIPKRGNTI